MARKPDRKPNNGVRGPQGPNRGSQPPPNRPPASRPASGPAGRPAPSSGRARFEEWSYPMIARVHAMPRWIVVIAPAILLFVGLVLTGSWAWLGAIMLFLVFLMLGWLTALSWPVLTPGSRLIRLIVVLALLGITVFKLTGRF